MPISGILFQEAETIKMYKICFNTYKNRWFKNKGDADELGRITLCAVLFCAKRENNSLYFAGTVIYSKADCIYNNSTPKQIDTDKERDGL